MKRKLFIRDVRARGRLELFIVSAVASLLLLRYYLYLTGYPQVGSGSLHIAHMLWGGVCMLLSIVLLLSYMGRRLQRFAALLGGVGFGIFIDEIGKFITRDNNYFFRPAVGIIYAVFVLLYLLLEFITRSRTLNSTEYQLNALAQLEEAVLREMDEHEKQAVAALLDNADPDSPITKQLRSFLAASSVTKKPKPSLIQRCGTLVDKWYERLWKTRRSNTIVRLFFVLQIIVFAMAVALPLYNNAHTVAQFFRGQSDYGHSLVIGQAFATIVAAICVGLGVYRLRQSRREAFEWFRRATLTNLLLTEFFIFSRIQFGAMAGFIFNLVLLLAINFVLAWERRAAN